MGGDASVVDLFYVVTPETVGIMIAHFYRKHLRNFKKWEVLLCSCPVKTDRRANVCSKILEKVINSNVIQTRCHLVPVSFSACHWKVLFSFHTRHF